MFARSSSRSFCSLNRPPRPRSFATLRRTPGTWRRIGTPHGTQSYPVKKQQRNHSQEFPQHHRKAQQMLKSSFMMMKRLENYLSKPSLKIKKLLKMSWTPTLITWVSSMPKMIWIWKLTLMIFLRKVHKIPYKMNSKKNKRNYYPMENPLKVSLGRKCTIPNCLPMRRRNSKTCSNSMMAALVTKRKK